MPRGVSTRHQSEKSGNQQQECLVPTNNREGFEAQLRFYCRPELIEICNGLMIDCRNCIALPHTRCPCRRALSNLFNQHALGGRGMLSRPDFCDDSAAIIERLGKINHSCRGAIEQNLT